MLLTLFSPVCTWLDAVGDAADRYTTRRGDTLWEIAGRYVPDDTMTTYQMMIALFDANLGAFINNDINLLKIGYALHIPTREELGMPPAPPKVEDEGGAAAFMGPPVFATEEADAASAIVAEEMAKLQDDLALTQERATRRHDENEALRARVAALEARVIKLDELTSAQDTAGRDGKAVTQPDPPSRMAAWFTVSNTMMILGVMIVLGLAAIWFWGRRATANTTATKTAASVAPQTRAEQPTTEATGPLALGLGGLEADTEHPGAAQDVTAVNPNASLTTEAAADAARAHLMIDLDDLELEPAQSGGETPGLPSTASISPKADPSSPSNAG
jgi:FimV-like protein